MENSLLRAVMSITSIRDAAGRSLALAEWEVGLANLWRFGVHSFTDE